MASQISHYYFWWYSKRIVIPQDFLSSQESFLGMYINIPFLLYHFFFISLNLILSWLSIIWRFGKVSEFTKIQCLKFPSLIFTSSKMIYSHILNCSHFYLTKKFFAINNEPTEVSWIMLSLSSEKLNSLLLNILDSF